MNGKIPIDQVFVIDTDSGYENEFEDILYTSHVDALLDVIRAAEKEKQKKYEIMSVRELIEKRVESAYQRGTEIML